MAVIVFVCAWFLGIFIAMCFGRAAKLGDEMIEEMEQQSRSSESVS